MRERHLLDRNWRFALGHAGDVKRDFEFARSRYLIKAGEAKGAAASDFDDSGWRAVDLPHDWAVELPFDSSGDKDLLDHGYHAIGPDHPENSVGWYRRVFDLSASDDGQRISIEFDGVFRDSTVFVNGHYMGRHASGYTPFRYDITDVAQYGGRNVVAVRVDASLFEGWWYEGAGIYRHVRLTKTSPLHIADDGVFVTSKVGRNSADVTIRTRIVNESDAPVTFQLISSIHPGAQRQRRPGSGTTRSNLKPWSEVELVQKLHIPNPRLWSCGEPHLYHLHSTVKTGRKVADDTDTIFGIRTLRWHADRGFFLNGEPLKIRGFCCHEDHAGVGVAVPDALHALRLAKLKETGCNAYRAAHNAATPAVLDACDRLGLLVMAETRHAGSHPEALDNLGRMILRDRNHPSIILWSIGNEEHTIQWNPVGERIARSMKRLVRRLDPTRAVTAAMHDRSSAEGFMKVVDVHGWNYTRVGDIEAFRKSKPKRPIVGSEESSVMTTRGVYADDPARGYCSAYDVKTPKWGLRAEAWWSFVADRPWLAGGFAWTGFDHRGEPIAYQWPNVVSHFGVMDLCGFPKDNFYYYQAWWSDPRQRTVLHLFPHWSWRGREGEMIDVRCFSNCEEVELVVNGRSAGRKKMPWNSHLAWTVPFEAGVIEAFGYRDGQRIAAASRETSDDPAAVALKCERNKIDADGEDVVSITASVVDARGRHVPTADNLIEFELKGPARLLGVGNGDPSSHEPDKAPRRKLFNGLAAALIQTTDKSGRITLIARSQGLKEAKLTVEAIESLSHRVIEFNDSMTR
ncbi:MAG: beta-galactosidase GalA [Tepidisphaeraceae bacterium]